MSIGPTASASVCTVLVKADEGRSALGPRRRTRLSRSLENGCPHAGALSTVLMSCCHCRRLPALCRSGGTAKAIERSPASRRTALAVFATASKQRPVTASILADTDDITELSPTRTAGKEQEVSTEEEETRPSQGRNSTDDDGWHDCLKQGGVYSKRTRR